MAIPRRYTTFLNYNQFYSDIPSLFVYSAYYLQIKNGLTILFCPRSTRSICSFSTSYSSKSIISDNQQLWIMLWESIYLPFWALLAVSDLTNIKSPALFGSCLGKALIFYLGASCGERPLTNIKSLASIGFMLIIVEELSKYLRLGPPRLT